MLPMELLREWLKSVVDVEKTIVREPLLRRKLCSYNVKAIEGSGPRK